MVSNGRICPGSGQQWQEIVFDIVDENMTPGPPLGEPRRTRDASTVIQDNEACIPQCIISEALHGLMLQI